MSDDDAAVLCGEGYLRLIGAKRKEVGLRKRRRVQVNGKITLEAADFNCTHLTIEASVLMSGAADRATGVVVPTSSSRMSSSRMSSSRMSDSRELSRNLSTGAAQTAATGGSSPEVAEAVLSFLAGATRNLHERYARYEEVDRARFEHFEKVVVPNARELRDNEMGERPPN